MTGKTIAKFGWKEIDCGDHSMIEPTINSEYSAAVFYKYLNGHLHDVTVSMNGPDGCIEERRFDFMDALPYATFEVMALQYATFRLFQLVDES